LAPPAQVTGLSGAISDNIGTHLRWNPVQPTGVVSGYRLYRGGQAEEDSFQLLAVVPDSVTTYLDATSGCGQIYYLTAFNPAGESPASTSSYYSPACRP